MAPTILSPEIERSPDFVLEGSMARFLTLSDENKDKVDLVIAYAMSNPYILDAPNAVSPGDIPGHCCFLDTYHCVFSFTVHMDRTIVISRSPFQSLVGSLT